MAQKIEEDKPEKGQLYIPVQKQAVRYMGRKVTPIWRVTTLLQGHVFAREMYFKNEVVISFADLRQNYALIHQPSEIYTEEELSVMSPREREDIRKIFFYESNVKTDTPRSGRSLWKKFLQSFLRRNV